MLNQICQAFAKIHTLTVTDCEQAFDCKLQRDVDHARRYWGACPDLHIESLDIRIGKSGGIVVATFEAGFRASLAEELNLLGEPEEVDIVSPGIRPTSAPKWQRKWSVGQSLFGTKVYFGIEEIEGCEYLITASRKFDMAQSES